MSGTSEKEDFKQAYGGLLDSILRREGRGPVSVDDLSQLLTSARGERPEV